MKKYKNIKKIAIILLFVFFILCNVCFTNSYGKQISPEVVKEQKTNIANNTRDIMKKTIGIGQVIAISIAIIVLLYLAIKYMTAAPSEKADVKKGIEIYVVGAILIFGTSAVINFAKSIAESLSEGL